MFSYFSALIFQPPSPYHNAVAEASTATATLTTPPPPLLLLLYCGCCWCVLRVFLKINKLAAVYCTGGDGRDDCCARPSCCAVIYRAGPSSPPPPPPPPPLLFSLFPTRVLKVVCVRCCGQGSMRCVGSVHRMASLRGFRVSLWQFYREHSKMHTGTNLAFSSPMEEFVYIF